MFYLEKLTDVVTQFCLVLKLIHNVQFFFSYGDVNRRKRTRVSKIRIVKGQVALRVTGRPGVQHIGAGQLVRFVPINKLRAAAQRVLNQSVSGRRRRGGRIKKKSRRRRQRQRR